MQQVGRAAAAVATTVVAASFDGSCPSGAVHYQRRISSLAASVRARVLASARGTGNRGERGSAAFYVIEDERGLPPSLRNMAAAPPGNGTRLERVDIDLGPNRLAFWIDDVLSHEEADALAACAEAILEDNGHSRVAPGISTPPGMRVNEAAHWYPSAALAPKLLGPIYDRVRRLVPGELDGMPLHSKLSEKVAQFKYSPGDRFERHVDGLFPGQGADEEGTGVTEWTGVSSGMSMLFYLNDGPNDGLVGGETRLWSEDGRTHVDVAPRKGRVLFFRRGSRDAVLHAGMPVAAAEEGGGTPKYMALINLAYGSQTGTRPLM